MNQAVNQIKKLPQGWRRAPLRETADIVRGISFPKEARRLEPQEGSVACLRTANVQREVDWGDLWFVPEEYVKLESRYVRLFDVLISVSNSLELVGKVAQVTSLPHKSTLGAFISLLRPSTEIDAKLYYYQLTSSDMQSEIRRYASTTTNISNISSSRLAEIPLSVPPLAEQRRIVAEIEKQFTRLDGSVAALKRVQTNLKRYRASVLKAACEGKLVPIEAGLARSEGCDYESADCLLARILAERRARWEAQEKRRGKYVEPSPPDPSDLPELPEGWAWATVAQLAEIQGGIQKQPKRAPADNPFPFLRVANVLRGSLDLQEVHKIELFSGELDKLRLFSGDLLIVEGNGSPSQIGRMAIWKGEIEDCVHQNHIIRARLYSGLIPQYVESYWNSPIGASGVSKVASSTSGLYTLSVSKVSDLPVPLPPLAEQHRIIAEVERRLSVVQQAEGAVEVNLTRAERLRQSILKQAFSGKLIPQDPNDEPASALLERIRVEREASHADAKKSRQTRPRRGKSLSARQFVLREGNP